MKKRIFLPITILFFITACSSTDESINTKSGYTQTFNETPISKDQKIGTINFAFDSAKINENEQYLIENTYKAFLQNRNVKIVITGHTDEIGTEAYNMELGLERAKNVKSKLVSMGVPAEQITINSFGERRPLVDATKWNEHQINRRATIQIQSNQSPQVSMK